MQIIHERKIKCSVKELRNEYFIPQINSYRFAGTGDLRFKNVIREC